MRIVRRSKELQVKGVSPFRSAADFRIVGFPERVRSQFNGQITAESLCLDKSKFTNNSSRANVNNRNLSTYEDRLILTNSEVIAASSRSRLDKLMKVLSPLEGYSTKITESVSKTDVLRSKTERNLYRLS